ncbi:MAG: 54S ribosomal protein L9, mitochondrial [Bathelium mastoideum]|nr:MAG: 54S ribosomal protein L9, mitochondrial [Bathelium mastoideum]
MPPKRPIIALLPPRSLLPRRPTCTSFKHHHHPPSLTRGIRSISPVRPNRFNHHPSLPALSSTKTGAYQRKLAANTLPLRTGALATKAGMTALYDATSGARTPCTVLQLDRNQVLAHKTRRRHGYFAVQVGAGWRQPRNLGRPMAGHFEAAGTSAKRHVAEFRVRDGEGLRGVEVGREIGAGWFVEGQFVDTRSNSRGMGFAGGMKRYGFSGQPASHGVSLTHRSIGSAGGSQGSGSRVHPGKKMPGRMGGEQVTIQNLKVLKVDPENGLVVVNGCVSGPKGCLVKIQDAIKKPWPEVMPEPPSPALAAEPLRATV